MIFLPGYLAALEGNDRLPKRSKLVVGNWKMHLVGEEAKKLANACKERIKPKEGCETVLCPSFTLLHMVHFLIKDTSIKVGAQDVFWKEQGAFTGKVSPKMLLDSGVHYCIVGHSETRGRFGKLAVHESTLGYFGETNETIHLKIQALLEHSIAPILCVGETYSEHAEDLTEQIIKIQLIEALEKIELSWLSEVVIAYEPVWAIGTGEVCDPEEAEKVCAFIRKILAERFDPDIAGQVRILYGGSLKADNAEQIFKQPNIDGGLVGTASLDPEEFCQIIEMI